MEARVCTCILRATFTGNAGPSEGAQVCISPYCTAHIHLRLHVTTLSQATGLYRRFICHRDSIVLLVNTVRLESRQSLESTSCFREKAALQRRNRQHVIQTYNDCWCDADAKASISNVSTSTSTNYYSSYSHGWLEFTPRSLYEIGTNVDFFVLLGHIS